MIRKIGYVLLVGGFAGIVLMCVNVSVRRHPFDMENWKRLPEEAQIPRDIAVHTADHLALNTRFLVCRNLVPATIMLVGGLMVGARKKTMADSAQQSGGGCGLPPPHR